MSAQRRAEVDLDAANDAEDDNDPEALLAAVYMPEYKSYYMRQVKGIMVKSRNADKHDGLDDEGNKEQGTRDADTVSAVVQRDW